MSYPKEKNQKATCPHREGNPTFSIQLTFCLQCPSAESHGHRGKWSLLDFLFSYCHIGLIVHWAPQHEHLSGHLSMSSHCPGSPPVLVEFSCRVKSINGITQAPLSGSQVESAPVNDTEKFGNCSRDEDIFFLKGNKAAGVYLSGDNCMI